MSPLRSRNERGRRCPANERNPAPEKEVEPSSVLSVVNLGAQVGAWRKRLRGRREKILGNTNAIRVDLLGSVGGREGQSTTRGIKVDVGIQRERCIVVYQS